MLEHELNPAASKFISSLVKSLQLLCNGHVDYSESIELVGHINVRVDHQHKYDYIVDEQVSKEGNNSSTFLSNSYYSHPPTKSVPAVASQAESHTSQKQNLTADNPPSRSSHHTIRVNHRDGSRKQDNILVKMEGNDDDCMVLPASPEDYDPVDGEPEECGPLPGTSSAASESYEMGYDAPHTRQTGKKRKMEDRNSSEAGSSDSKAERGEGKTSGGKRSASELIGKFAAYECSYCSVILTEYEDLTLHSKSCPSPSCSMICMTCGEKLPNKPEMRQHLKLVHSHKTFGCKYCDMMFLSSSGLLSHTKAKHRPDAKTLCQLCGQAFHNKANLEGHMNMHLGIRPFRCKKCGKSYGHSKSLITHDKMCKSILSSPKNISAKIQARSHIRSQSKLNSKSANKKVEKKDLPSAPPVTEATQSTQSTQSQPIVYETYQPFEGREDKREASTGERTMTLIPNSNQNFTFTDSSYPQTFVEPVSQTNLVMSAMNSPNAANVAMANTVYAHPNTSFVLPQVAYGMYQQGILPDQR